MPSKYFRSTDTTVELKDTMKLQKASLDLFSQQLGYWWDEDDGSYFGCDSGCIMRGKMTLSLRKIQQWHNLNFVSEAESFPWHGEDILPEVAERLGFSELELKRAIESKLVHRTNLQYSKKRKELICVDHQVSFS
jgi:hypothetical protein